MLITIWTSIKFGDRTTGVVNLMWSYSNHHIKQLINFILTLGQDSRKLWQGFETWGKILNMSPWFKIIQEITARFQSNLQFTLPLTKTPINLKYQSHYFNTLTNQVIKLDNLEKKFQYIFHKAITSIYIDTREST